jgi:hypothetical protein
MNWMAWIAVLVVWPLVGLGVACLFGRFIRGAEAPDNAGDLMPSVLSYLRRDRRDTTSRVGATTHAKGRREAAGGHRVH